MSIFPRILLFFLLVAVATTGWSQSVEEQLNEPQIFSKFGNVGQEELTQTAEHPYPFEYLLNESSIRFHERGGNIVAEIDYLIRLKVYSNDPLEIAEASLVGIPFYFADGMERVSNLEGITWHPDGTRSILDLQRARTVDLNSRYKIIEFEMPEVEEGSVIEYKYTLERRYIEELPDFHFAHRVPVREARVFLKNESYLRFDVVKQNTDFEVNYVEQRIDTSRVPFVFTYQRPDPIYIQKWSAEEIPAVETSSYISSLDDIRGKLKFQISEFGLPRQPLENSWEFVAAQIRRNANPYHVLEGYDHLKELGREIADGIENLVEIQDTLFQYVNTRAQFNELNAVFIEESLDHVLEGTPANQAEINMVLLALLRGAGIDAKPLYISGRDFGRINMEFPSLYQFNRMLVVSEIEGRNYFMDASFSHSLPDLIPVESYNEQGMILSGQDYSWIEITPDKSLFHLDIVLDAALTTDGDLVGDLEATVRGYPSQQIRRGLERGEPVSNLIAGIFFEVYSDVEIDASSIQESDDGRDQFEVKTAFRIPDYAITFNDGMEFRPMIVGYLFRNPFESTRRRVPITMDAPETLSLTYRIELPEGFQTDVIEGSQSTNLPGAGLTEKYTSSQNRLEYTFDIDIHRKEFPTGLYPQLRRVYERWVSLSNDVWFIQNRRSGE